MYELCILSTLLYFIHFLSIRYLFSLFILCVISSIVLAFKLPKEISEISGQNINNGAYLLLPAISFIILVWASFRKKQIKVLLLAEQGFFLGLLFVLVGALFIIYREKAEFDTILSFQPPYNLAFYGIQVLGVFGAVLTTYVRTLPKQ